MCYAYKFAFNLIDSFHNSVYENQFIMLCYDAGPAGVSVEYRLSLLGFLDCSIDGSIIN